MRMIPTRIHGYLDYIVGLLLIAAPWLLGFNRGGAETIVPVALGAAAIVYSVFTRYELGLVKAIPMSAHLAMDVASGVLLAISPWLFGFSEFVWIPHVVVGIVEILAGLMTQATPELVPAHAHHPPQA